MFSTLPLLLGSALIAASVAGCSPDPEAARTPATDPVETPVPAAVSVGQVLEETEGAGDVRLLIDVRAEMPPAFDDGQPRRSYQGRGFLDWEAELAGVTYEVSDVPNAVGYFGHVENKLSVFHSDPGFVASFPVLVKALDGEGEWFRYELEDFSQERIRKLGIGQLREIGLSDPRLGLGLLRGLPDQLTEGFYSPVEETAATNYVLTADVAAAAAEAPDGLAPQFDALLDLGVDEVDVELALDPLERVRRVKYELSYPPAPESPPVRLSVTLDLLKFGLEGGLTPPPEARVLDYSDYISR